MNVMLLSSKLILITMASMVQGQEVALPYDQDKQLSRFRSYVSAVQISNNDRHHNLFNVIIAYSKVPICIGENGGAIISMPTFSLKWHFIPSLGTSRTPPHSFYRTS